MRVLTRSPTSFNVDPPNQGGLDCGTNSNNNPISCTAEDIFLAGNSFVKAKDFTATPDSGNKWIEMNGKKYFWYVDYKCVDSNGGGVRSSSDADANTLLDSDNDGVPDYIDSDSDGDGIYDYIEAFKCAYSDKKKSDEDQLKLWRGYFKLRGFPAPAGGVLPLVPCWVSGGTKRFPSDSVNACKVKRQAPERCYAMALADPRCSRGGLTEITFSLNDEMFECYCPTEGPQYLHKDNGIGVQDWGTSSIPFMANFLCESGTDGKPLDSGKRNIQKNEHNICIESLTNPGNAFCFN